MIKRIDLLRTSVSLAVLSLVSGCDWSLSPVPSDTSHAKPVKTTTIPIMNGHHMY
jgi:hypothetical protein